jgi:hypothetical protein
LGIDSATKRDVGEHGEGPPPTTPAEASNQPEAGISALAVPSPTRV